MTSRQNVIKRERERGKERMGVEGERERKGGRDDE